MIQFQIVGLCGPRCMDASFGSPVSPGSMRVWSVLQKLRVGEEQGEKDE